MLQVWRAVQDVVCPRRPYSVGTGQGRFTEVAVQGPACPQSPASPSPLEVESQRAPEMDFWLDLRRCRPLGSEQKIVRDPSAVCNLVLLFSHPSLELLCGCGSQILPSGGNVDGVEAQLTSGHTACSFSCVLAGTGEQSPTWSLLKHSQILTKVHTFP